MKKYLIFAAVALVASAACSKVEVDNTPSKKISFEVANYIAQTKAAEDPTSVNSETTSFSTKAWLHANGAAVGTNFFGSSDNNYTETVTYSATPSPVWEPAWEYFWPKTANSYINFVSWYSKNSKSPAPFGTTTSDQVSETIMNWGNATSPVTIVSDDNILFADEAWRYKDNDDDYTGQSGVAGGVPTLFHHALAKVIFKIRLSTTTASTKSIWDVAINSATLTVGNNGYLALVNVDPTTNKTNPWGLGKAYDADDDDTYATSKNVGWTRPTTATNEVIVETSNEAESGVTKSFATPDWTFKPTALTDGHYTSGEWLSFLPERTVLPQAVENGVVKFGMSFTIKVFHASDGNKVDINGDNQITDADAFSTETITIADTTPLHTLVGEIDNWKMNTIYTYNITIDPVGKSVKFDPAVATWATVDQEKEIYNAKN